MTPQDNIKIVRNIFDAWNEHDPDRYVKLLDEKHVVESDPIPAALTGREAGRQFTGHLLRQLGVLPAS